MRKSRFSEGQIIGVLREQESGATTAEVCRRHGISEQTFYRWKARYGGLGPSDAQRLKSLEDENRRLKITPILEDHPRSCWRKRCWTSRR